jgi:Ni/Co efflux regulator RcnB
MKLKAIVFAAPMLAFALISIPVAAQDHHDQDRHDQDKHDQDRQDRDHHDQGHSQDRHDNSRYQHHNEWKRGYRFQHEDWDRGDRVDYRTNHLSRPPAGREWRRIDGNFVLGDQNGVIFSIRVAPRY